MLRSLLFHLTYPATRAARLSSALLAILTAGCGLAHYQEQMAAEQHRVKRLDEEHDLLDVDPLKLPDKKERPSYFFLPPKGISSTGVPHDSSVLQRFAPRVATNTPFQDVSFGVEKMKPDDFWGSFLRAFPGRKSEDAREVVINPASGRKLKLRELKSEDGLSYGYVWSEGDNHAAVVFRLLHANDETTKKLMEVSLGTLTVGTNAPGRRTAHEAWKNHMTQEAARQKQREQEKLSREQ